MPVASSAEPRRDPTIEALLAPWPVAAFAATIDPAHLESLGARERPAPGAVGAPRQAEYATGRACARSALAAVDRHGDVVRGTGGEPLWPMGSTGSISHSGPHCVAVVSDSGEVTVGVDIERVSRVRPVIARRVTTPVERRRLDTLDPAAAQLVTAVTFAVKEAFYKAHHQREPRWLGFDAIQLDAFALRVDAPVAVGVSAGSGSVDPSLLADVVARYRFDGDVVIAAVAIVGQRRRRHR